eukprot:11668709-Karenia_brevis.AAC.1
MPPPAGDPLAVKQSVPMCSHVGPSGYAANSQSTMAASSVMPNRDRISMNPSESVASSGSCSK